MGLELDGNMVGEVVDTLKRLEHEGYHFEAADASLELLMRAAGGWEQDWFSLESFKVYTWASVLSANLLVLARHALAE